MQFNRPGSASLFLLLAVVCSAGCTVRQTAAAKTHLQFRGYLQDFSTPDSDVFHAREFWSGRLAELSAEGFNAIVWTGAHEFSNGEHALVRHRRLPEARELSPSENERIIDQMRWLFRTAHRHGLRNILQTQHLFYTPAFARAHGLDAAMPTSATVAHWQAQGYPNFWRSDRGPVHSCGVRSELTVAYTQAVYEELLATYPELDGFYCFNGEAVPGRRSTFFGEAVLAAATASGRNPILIVSQWQTPLEEFVEDIAGTRARANNIWLGFHGYNSEQITDARPYPGLAHWRDATGLPTVADVYPGNQNMLPFNSPGFAFEIASRLRQMVGLIGFVYHERFIAGTLLGPLFRKALARYTARHEPYSEEHWLGALETRYGSRQAATHLLRAFDLSGRIVPELCALAYSGSDVMRRELRLPYAFFATKRPWSHMTSPARGGRLVPVRHYAEMIALRKDLRGSNGSDASKFPYYQEASWGSQGGSVFDAIPPEHMARIREMGAACAAEAAAAVPFVRTNEQEARTIADLMEAMRLLTEYYEVKVSATVEAIVYAQTRAPEDRSAAERLGDEALAKYIEAAAFMHERLDPYYRRLTGMPMHEAGVELPALMEQERRDRLAMAELFGWPP